MIPKTAIAFFDGYFRELEERQWPAVILHSWQSLPEHIPSDVDYLVAGVSPGELARFLNSYCHRSGWQLVQVMEHEPQAYYAVCVMTGPPWTAVKLDAAWDYQRKGRLLLPGTFLLKGRRIPKGKSFHVPATAAEFAYVFAKGLAKSKGASPVIERLAELWHEDPTQCRKALHLHFRISSVDESFPEAEIKAALDPENRSYSRWRSRQWGLRQITWLMRRLRQPYGMTLALPAGVDANHVGEILLSAFRRFVVVTTDPGPWRRRLMEFRSSLILGGPALANKPGVLDLTSQTTADACVAAALNHLHWRGGWSKDPTA